VFTHNYARQGGTVYWIMGSGMKAPMGRESNMFESNNECGNHGCAFATEIAKLVVTPSTIELSDYDSRSYPLNVEVRLQDYYGYIAGSDLETAVDSYVMRNSYDNDVKCGINNANAQLIGTIRSVLTNGMARLSSFSAICVPGGHLNATFTTSIRSLSANFPRYQSTSLSSSVGVVPQTVARLIPS
jgi:hypothetical protein